jgi:hypothetical protein
MAAEPLLDKQRLRLSTDGLTKRLATDKQAASALTSNFTHLCKNRSPIV